MDIETKNKIKIVMMLAMRTEHNEEYVVGLDENGNMNEWKWETGEWVPYKKA